VTHEEARELIPAYALDALDPDEARAAEAHFSVCEECRRELAGLREATALLAEGAPRTAPPAALRDRVLAAAQPARRHPARPWPWAWAGWAAAALAVAVLGSVSLSLERRVAAMRGETAAETRLLSLLASPSAKTVGLAGTTAGSVRLVFAPGRAEGVLVVSGLPDPGGRSVYQVWLISGPRPESAGVFRPSGGAPTVVPVDANVSRYRAVAISVEPGPRGSPQPTTRPVFTGAVAPGG
jgi:anti-sigma-K factor RskA